MAKSRTKREKTQDKTVAFCSARKKKKNFLRKKKKIRACQKNTETSLNELSMTKNRTM